MTRNRLLLLVPATLVFAAVAGAIVAVMESSESTKSSGNFASTRTSVNVPSGDGDANSVDVVVLVDGSSSTSVEQQVVRSGGRSEVDVDVSHDYGALTISGETTGNGRLVLRVVRDGTASSERFVVDGSDDRALVVRVDGNGDVRVGRTEPSDEDPCDPGAVDPNVDVTWTGADDRDGGDGGKVI